MNATMSAFQKFVDVQENFHASTVISFMQDHAELPVFSVVVYLAFVFAVPDQMKDRKPFRLRNLWAVWNVAFSVFSLIGAYFTVLPLLKALWTEGFKYTICTPPSAWFHSGYTGFWMSLFILSKFPELFDTVFLVLQKKEVIFLHWFHHVTVLLYCWHAFVTVTAPGLWFAAVNYSVHAVMYGYYALMVVGPRKMVKFIAPYITLAQTLQMVMGITVSLFNAYYLANGEACAVDPANVKLALGMYFSYFVLFSILFKRLYCPSIKPKDFPNTPERQICGVNVQTGDASGRFVSRQPINVLPGTETSPLSPAPTSAFGTTAKKRF